MREINVSKIEEIIFPLKYEEFKNYYWEKKVFIASRNNKNYYKKLFSFEEFDQIIQHSVPNGNKIDIVKSSSGYEKKNAVEYQKPDGNLNPNNLYAFYCDGYSIIINGVNRYNKNINNLINKLRIELSSTVNANMYLTPANQVAFSPHYDSHDVFVLQLSGEKHWNIYKNDKIETPLVNSHQPTFEKEQLTIEKEINLKEGDFMYIPRGVPHGAFTTESSSLHLTIGIYPLQWVDLLKKSIEVLALNEVQLRKALPLGIFNKENQETIFKELNKIEEFFPYKKSTNLNLLGTALSCLFDDHRKALDTFSDSNFASLDKMAKINYNSMIMQRDNMNCRVLSNSFSSKITFAGNSVQGPTKLHSTFKYIAGQKGAYAVKDIPMFENKHKIKIVKRLIRGGLLKIVSKN